ncbi:MAG: carbon starvation protein A [Bacteriovoracaceae bacterium]|nr:carbon starvation protein A [Bacteriovoracaceae bacterium]
MNGAVLGFIGISLFLLAYRFYGQFIANKLFKLEEEDRHNNPTPAVAYSDGVDFVPTSKSILIGHHFSSIAGAAPIVGPAVAAIWGWLPALLWITIGVIFIGACHDFGALVLSMHHRGNSVAYVAGQILGNRVRNLFLIVIFFLIWMVIAVFALVISNLFVSFPSAVLPVNFEIIVAVLMGLFINKGGNSLKIPSLLAQLTLFVMIYLGTKYPISLTPLFGEHALMAWMLFLLIYSFIASVLPVWILLQPRDYINGHQLAVGLFLMVTGLFIVQPDVVAPMLNLHPEGAPPIFPFLFITIACGAISGFHGLVSGGTTSKQVKNWQEAKPVAYGSMLGEGLLALLATLAVTAGFKTPLAWHTHYANWNAANGLAAKINAFVTGSSRFIAGWGIPEEVGQTLMAVLIISFAATSLDTACRIQRYIIGEVGDAIGVKSLKNKYFGSFIAVASAFALMISSDGGKGGLKIWPLFGATNQMLAALTLILISLYLIRKKRNAWPFIIPSIIICFITTIGLILNISRFFSSGNIFLTTLASLLFLSQCWILVEAYLLLRNKGRTS